MKDWSNLSEISTPLPWHRQEWQRINAQLSDGLLPHALMLVGQQFSGKSEFSVALARRLLCDQSQGAFNCGHCHACNLSFSGNHGDFLWIEPQDKSRLIKIDQVRSLVRFTNRTAGYGSRKVVVLNPANSMNINSFNALLKSLEEPAKDTYMILVCHRIDAIPATIRSRCHILRLGCPDETTALAWLDSYTGSSEESQKILALADNLPLLARQVYLSGTTEAMVEQRRIFDHLINGQIDVIEAAGLWGDPDIMSLLEHQISDLQVRLGGMTDYQLRTKRGRATFHLLDELIGLQRAVGAGANPSKQLLLDALMSKYSRYLGGRVVDDKI